MIRGKRLARLVSQLVILTGMRDGAERGKELESAIQEGAMMDFQAFKLSFFLELS